MKRILGSFFVCMIVLMLVSSVFAAPKVGTTIQDGVLVYQPGHYLAGQLLQMGYDIFGYNYQAHRFNGLLVNSSPTHPPYDGDGDHLVMRWNDAWLSNMDMDGDGKLDRPASYIGSGAWETNHQFGIDADGKQWTYFVKIIAVPSDATNIGGIWYAANGVEIGPSIWGSFAIIQEIYSGKVPNYISPSGPGFGKW